MSPATWRRILLGDAPVAFALEVLLRTVVVYLFLITAVRLLGKRMSGQVTNLELGVMLTLGAIVSVPMETAERGIVPGLALLCAVVAIQRAFSQVEACSPFATHLLVGKTSMLVSDGVVRPAELSQAHLSQQQLFSVLRTQQVRHLGELERVYLEAYGAFSVLRRDKPLSGLSVLPSTGTAIEEKPRQGWVCAYCGLAAPKETDPRAQCENCEHSTWTEPVRVEQGGA